MAKLFSEILKDGPGVGDVHVPAAIGGSESKKRKKKDFAAFVSGGTGKPEVVLPTTTSVNKNSFSEIMKAGFHGAGGARHGYPSRLHSMGSGKKRFRKIYFTVGEDL